MLPFLPSISPKAGGSMPISLTGGEATGGTASSGIDTRFAPVIISKGVGMLPLALLILGGFLLWKKVS